MGQKMTGRPRQKDRFAVRNVPVFATQGHILPFARIHRYRPEH